HRVLSRHGGTQQKKRSNTPLKSTASKGTGEETKVDCSASARKQYAAAQWAAADAHCGYFRRIGDLASDASSPQLSACLMQQPVAMETACGELATHGVEREFAVERYPMAAFDEPATFPFGAKPQCFEPHDGKKAEPVIECGYIDIAGLEIGSRPKHRGRVTRSHGREIIELIPRRATAKRASDCLHFQRRLPEVAGSVTRRNHHRGAAIDRDVAIVETQRIGNHARREVVVEAEWFAENRLGIARRVPALVQRDCGELLAGRAELVKMTHRHHCDPVGRGLRAERHLPLIFSADSRMSAANQRCAPLGTLRGRLP